MVDATLDKINKFVPEKWRWVLAHGGFRKYFKNTGWMFLGQMFSLLMAFFVGVWMARYLGPENYGILSYILAFVGLFSFIASLGVDGILSRELVKHPEQRNELLGTAFYLKLFGGILAIIVSVVVIFSIEASSLIKFLALLFSLTFIFQSFNVISSFFQANVRAKKNVKAQIISSSITSVFKIIMIVYGMGVIWLVAIYVLESMLFGFFLITAYRSLGLQIRKWNFDSKLARQILSSSWLLMLTGVSVSIYMKIDQVVIKMMIDESAVGIYSVATKLSEIWSFIPVIICGSLFPAIINAKKVNETFYLSRLKKLFLLMLLLAVVISALISSFAKPIILKLFGQEYFGAISVLAIYVWSTVGVFMSVAVGKYLLAENYLKVYFFITLLGAVSNVILNLILIPILGISGAAWATVISYAIVPLPALLLFKFNLK